MISNPLTACSTWLQNEWPGVTLSGYFMWNLVYMGTCVSVENSVACCVVFIVSLKWWVPWKLAFQRNYVDLTWNQMYWKHWCCHNTVACLITVGDWYRHLMTEHSLRCTWVIILMIQSIQVISLIPMTIVNSRIQVIQILNLQFSSTYMLGSPGNTGNATHLPVNVCTTKPCYRKGDRTMRHMDALDHFVHCIAW